MQDETRSFNYLIGIAEEVDDESGDKDKRIASFRISRILRASLMKSMGAFISKENNSVNYFLKLKKKERKCH